MSHPCGFSSCPECGTGEELIKKAYSDSEKSGKCYEAIVKAQELIDSVL